MKTNLLLLVFAAAGTFLAGCDKENNNPVVPPTVETIFGNQYPEATRVGWVTKNNCRVAGFLRNNTEAEAWYDAQGVWCMTETDIRYTNLPQAVKTAFEQSEYADWHIDDVDMLEYPDRETVFVIEVEQGKAEYDLWFSPDGVLAKAVPDDNYNGNGNNNGNGNGNNNSEHQPTTILPSIKTFIAEKYPQARIVDIEKEHNTIEVDIVDDRTPREVVFSQQSEWLRTVTELRKTDIPASLLGAIGASQYSSWHIDDVDYHVTPAGEYYMVELEYGKSEVKLKIDPNGNIL